MRPVPSAHRHADPARRIPHDGSDIFQPSLCHIAFVAGQAKRSVRAQFGGKDRPRYADDPRRDLATSGRNTIAAYVACS